MIVLIQQILLLVDVGSHSQLNFPDQSSVVRCVDENVSGTLVESVLHPHNLKIFISFFEVFQGLNDPDDFFLVRVALAPEEVEYLERDQVD